MQLREEITPNRGTQNWESTFLSGGSASMWYHKVTVYSPTKSQIPFWSRWG